MSEGKGEQYCRGQGEQRAVGPLLTAGREMHIVVSHYPLLRWPICLLALCCPCSQQGSWIQARMPLVPRPAATGFLHGMALDAGQATRGSDCLHQGEGIVRMSRGVRRRSAAALLIPKVQIPPRREICLRCGWVCSPSKEREMCPFGSAANDQSARLLLHVDVVHEREWTSSSPRAQYCSSARAT
jgi:hypothetical protein